MSFRKTKCARDLAKLIGLLSIVAFFAMTRSVVETNIKAKPLEIGSSGSNHLPENLD